MPRFDFEMTRTRHSWMAGHVSTSQLGAEVPKHMLDSDAGVVMMVVVVVVVEVVVGNACRKLSLYKSLEKNASNVTSLYLMKTARASSPGENMSKTLEKENRDDNQLKTRAYGGRYCYFLDDVEPLVRPLQFRRAQSRVRLRR